MKIKLLLFALLFPFLGKAQTTLANYFFENNLTVEAGSIGSPTLTASTSVSYFSGITGLAVSFASSTGKYFDLTISTVGYNNINISFAGRSSQTGSTWDATGDSNGGTTFSAITSLPCPNGSFASLPPTLLGAAYDNKSSIRIRITASGTSATLRLEDLILTGDCISLPAVPTGTITQSAPACGNTTLSYSAPSANLFWQTSPTGTSIANPTTSSYSVTTDGTYYVREKAGNCWSIAINSGFITINPLLGTTNPVNSSITDGNNTTFAVVGSGTVVGYQWQVDTGSGFSNLVNGAPYSNVLTATMTVTAATIGMNGYLYRCVVTGTIPCTTVTSTSAILTVTYTAPNNPTNLSSCFNNTSIDLSWTASSGGATPDGYMVFVLSGATAPASGTAGNASAYTANSNFSAAAVVTASLGKCVYKGIGTSVLVTGLTNAANYSYTVLAYRGNTATVWSTGVNLGGSWDITNITTDMPEVTSLSATIANNQSFVSWTNVNNLLTCSYQYLIVANQGAVVFTPSGDGTAYTANSVYGGANQVIYKGAGTNMTVTGLTNGLNYCYKLFVRRGTEWSNGVSICATPSLIYCVSSGNTTYSTSVTNVTLNTINNTSAKPSGYSDYTATTTNLTAGLTYTLSVNVNTAGNYEVDGYAWIDFNKNGLFTDAGESFNLGSATNVANGILFSCPLNITVPANAVLGTTRMRISASYTSGINSCSTAFDGEVEDYTINILAGCVSATITSVTPNMAPIGTEVTINATSGLTGATATFAGFAAIPVSSSATQLVVKVPPNAITGNLIVTNATLCAGLPLPYSIIKEDKTSCEGIGGTFNDLIISEIFDTDAGNGFYLELYNPTNAAITVNAANPTYRIEIDNDKGGVLNGVNRTINITGVIPAGGVIVYNFGTNTPGESPCISVATTNFFGNGTNANDGVYLTKNNVIIDKLVTTNETGYSMLRNLTAVGPTTTYNAADWSISGTESCANLGAFPANPKVAPVVTLNPTYSPSCKSTSLVIAGTEGFNGVGDTKELAYQWYVSAPAPAVTDWTALSDGGIYGGTSTINLSISNISGVINYQYYCQIRENTSTCFAATSAVKITDAGAVTWNGVDWRDSSNAISTPAIGKLAIINGPFNTNPNGSFDACSLVVNSPYTAIISSNDYINIQYDLTVNVGGNLIVQNNGSLVQIDDNGVNTGIISMQRTPTILRSTDYIYWSSPVSNFPVAQVSPASWLIYKWTPTILRPYASNFGGWLACYGDTMLPGKGYIIRGLDTVTATFTNDATHGSGVVNNGIINVGIERSTYNGPDYTYLSGSTTLTVNKDNDNYNLLGNPYASAIDADTFLTVNTNIEGHVRLWSHGTAISATNGQSFYNGFVLTYTASDYVFWNKLGPSTGPQSFNGKIAAGQGFFVTMNHSSASTTENITFNNSMRSKAYNNSNFFRTSNASKPSRIWLDITNDTGNSIRTLVGYDKEATLEKDRMYDAKINVDSNLNIYSLIDTEPQIIQGRPMPFDANDRVSLGIVIPTKSLNSASSASTYKIGIAFVDGIFNKENQDIFLEDKLLNNIHDLRKEPYVFTSNSGKFDDRFVLRYKTAAFGINNYTILDNDIIIATGENQIKIKSRNENIKSILVYDVLGAETYKKNNISTKEFNIKEVKANQQTLIVKVLLENGQIVTKKIIF
ncbi:GEVED domain-containing protein [Flavobacterium luteum]|uniref:Lamin tail domain-containing protein n=1 Tax=Flavobacterium luteum TaxID=2026654 RepID=A0A7J5AGZ4_9FLAO|nr:GEVED domain-containing protein [Flavobacterium luteum]KAB1156892.1 lamin tail domain-containing protein [Flavobacterium luteum]